VGELANSPETTLNIDTPPPLTSGESRASWASAISLAEGGLLADVSLVFDLAWIYIPIVGMAFIPLIPTPFTILYLRRGARITFFAACVGGFLMTVLVGPHYGWRLAFEGIIGLAMGWMMRRRWPPLLAITLTILLNTAVAYVAAFAAVYALALPLGDLFSEFQNLLIGIGWVLDKSTALFGLQAIYLPVRPSLVVVAHFMLTYWIPMFGVYIVALTGPTDVLYYSVASTTAFALGQDVRPFPPRWVWSALRVIGLALSPFIWLARLLWRVVTAPLWGPIWLAQALARWRRRRRLSGELAQTLHSPAAAPTGAEAPALVETTSGREARPR
jgi:hypothetical protein